MKLLIILGLAVAAAAKSSSPTSEIIRMGSVGLSLNDVKSTLVPRSDPSVAVPAYELKFTHPDVPEQDTERYKFRCGVITESYRSESTRPVFLCRKLLIDKRIPDPTERNAFLFSDELTLAPHVKEIELTVGKGTAARFVASYLRPQASTRRKSVMEGVYDGFRLLAGKTSYGSLLGYDI